MTSSSSAKRQRPTTLSAVALFMVVAPSMCFVPTATRRPSTRRYFRNAEFTAVPQDVLGELFQTNAFLDSENNDLPSWLRVSSNDDNLRILRESMIESLFSENETLKLLDAIKQAANGDADKMSGAAEFCSILVETMEMRLNELIAAAFHYCSCIKQQQVQSIWEHNNNNHMEYFGCSEAIEIARDAARLKKLETVAAMVNSETCVSSHASNLMNLLLTETKDWRALAIRAAASLYRLSGILKSNSGELTPESVRASKEALYIYAPLASRLGMQRLKNELEGLAFRILYRRQYETVSALTHQIRQKSNNKAESSMSIGESMNKVLHKAKDEMREMLETDPQFSSHVQSFELMARAKEPYSMWKKMLRNGSAHVLDVPDAVALRIVLEAKKQSPDEDSKVTRARERALCYLAQKLCTDKWRPHPTNPRFKDYIDYPKPNGYQSLHYTASTAWGGEDWMMEVQVRTKEMHKVAEFGLASHWDYKAQQKTTTPKQNNIHSKKSVDRSTEAYVKSLQQWHWEQCCCGAATKPSPSFLPGDNNNNAESQARANRIRARAEQMEPYLQALGEARSDLAREYVFVFLTQSNGSGGKVLALPAGACVVDALRSLGFPWRDEALSRVSHNGCDALLTAKLRNGDILDVVATTAASPVAAAAFL